MSRIRFLDTTLRDGELAPGFKPSAGERAEIANALEAAGIDVIELESTADDDESFAISKRIARELERAAAEERHPAQFSIGRPITISTE